MAALSGPVSIAWTRRLPKIELHAHLTGSISRACLHDIWASKAAQDSTLPVQDPLVAIPHGKVDYDINTFFPLFSSYIYKLCNDLPSIKYSTERVLQDFQNDGVVYLELRTTPRSVPERQISKEDYIKAILTVFREHNEGPSNAMPVFLILSVDRRNSPIEADEVVDLAIKYRDAGVVGVDLCGDPSKGDMHTFTKTFNRAKSAGLKITLHFAETRHSASDEELQTLLSWQPDRLGHVIHVNDTFRRTIEDHKIGVELCLSCNVHARLTDGSFSDHHFGTWKNSKGPVILCTDDVGVFCSPLSEEYYLAATHFSLDRKQIKDLCEGAIASIFATPEHSSRLRRIYSQWDGWHMYWFVDMDYEVTVAFSALLSPYGPKALESIFKRILHWMEPHETGNWLYGENELVHRES